MGFIAVQPNKKYCRFSTVTNTITHWNMTEEDYIKVIMERRSCDRSYAEKKKHEK